MKYAQLLLFVILPALKASNILRSSSSRNGNGNGNIPNTSNNGMNISDISDVDNITDSDSDSMPEGLHELSFTDSESEASEDLDDIRNTAFIPEGEEERVVVSHEVVANDNVNHDEEDDELNTAFLDLSPEMEEALRALQQQQGSQESE